MATATSGVAKLAGSNQVAFKELEFVVTRSEYCFLGFSLPQYSLSLLVPLLP